MSDLEQRASDYLMANPPTDKTFEAFMLITDMLKALKERPEVVVEDEPVDDTPLYGTPDSAEDEETRWLHQKVEGLKSLPTEHITSFDGLHRRLKVEPQSREDHDSYNAYDEGYNDYIDARFEEAYQLPIHRPTEFTKIGNKKSPKDVTKLFQQLEKIDRELRAIKSENEKLNEKIKADAQRLRDMDYRWDETKSMYGEAFEYFRAEDL